MIKYQQIGPNNQLMLVTFNSYSITNRDDPGIISYNKNKWAIVKN